MKDLLWRWPTPLHEGRLVRRYERFIAEVRLERGVVRAHCVNPGRMEGMVVPGARVWLSEAPGRHLPWTWELVELEGRLVGANTSLPNRLVGEVLRRGCCPDSTTPPPCTPSASSGGGTESTSCSSAPGAITTSR